jgi:uridine phosphorylase
MTPREPIHLRPTAQLAERVLLPGDPGRALALAQLLIEGPLMFNHHRGLWGYTGPAIADGEPLSIQSTGMGGPSAAIVLHELIALGAQRAIRVGTCGALDGGLALGDLVVAHEALTADGTSRKLGAGERIAADRELTAALAGSVAGGESPAQVASGERQSPAERDTEWRTHPGATVVSTDLFYEHDRARERAWRAAGAVAVEMEAAALFAVGARAGVPVACVLAVSDLIGEPGDGHQRIDDDALLASAEAMGRAAASALA